MPTQEPNQSQEPQQLEGVPEKQDGAAEQIKTIAVRVQDQLHSQLRFIAQLSGTSVSQEIRKAIETRITTVRDDPEFVARVQEARDQIEHEAAARTAAIAGFMGHVAAADVDRDVPKGESAGGRRGGNNRTASRKV